MLSKHARCALENHVLFHFHVSLISITGLGRVQCADYSNKLDLGGKKCLGILQIIYLEYILSLKMKSIPVTPNIQGLTWATQPCGCTPAPSRPLSPCTSSTSIQTYRKYGLKTARNTQSTVLVNKIVNLIKCKKENLFHKYSMLK